MSLANCLESFQAVAQPGRPPGLRRWSPVSREADVARVCKAGYQRGESCMRRGKTLGSVKGPPESWAKEWPAHTHEKNYPRLKKIQPPKIRGENPWWSSRASNSVCFHQLKWKDVVNNRTLSGVLRLTPEWWRNISPRQNAALIPPSELKGKTQKDKTVSK